MSEPIPDPDMSQLRFVIAQSRESQQMTIDKLAELSGVGRQTIFDIGSGRNKGNIETWIRLARALSVSLDDLVAPVWGSQPAE